MASAVGLAWALDAVLVLALLLLGWQALATRDLFRAIVLFIGWSLLVALAWVRLGALDVALAEAAIGAGITGALLLSSLGHLEQLREVQQEDGDDAPS